MCNTMSVKQLTRESILQVIKTTVEPWQTAAQDFFTTFGASSSCHLNCHALKEHFEHERSHSMPSQREARTKARVIRNQQHRVYLDSIHRWFTTAEIISSAANGCGTCSVLHSIIEIVFHENDSAVSKDYEYFFDSTFGLKRRVCSTDSSNPEEFVQLFQSRASGVSFERLPFSEFLLGSGQALIRARQWMQDCFSNHQVCKKYSVPPEGSPRPARLLDLRLIQRGDVTGIRLIDCPDEKESLQYACLSHRWDHGVYQCRTTTDNIAHAQDFLDEERLPTNFRDAIMLTRQLGVDFLWIDSMCIIQAGDGGEDLSREMGKMGAIYQGAMVTIVASASPNSAEGCFSCDKWPDIGMMISDNLGHSYLVGARALDKKGVPSTVQQVADRYPLLTRGWVFQERLLSPRLLQCNYGEFTFDCLESSRCECSSSLAPHPTALMQGRTVGFFRSSFRKLRLPPDGRGSEGARLEWKQATMRYWRVCVNTFMRSALTHPSDVLLAIAGCAQAIAPILCTTYVAGMWEEALPIDMLWYVTPGESRAKPQPRPKDTTAPSWSWASVAIGQAINYFELSQNGGKDPWSNTTKYLQKAITQITQEPESELNPLGRLKHASLSMTSILLPCHIRFFCDGVRPSKGQSRSRGRDLHTEDLRNLGECRTSVLGIAAPKIAVDLAFDAQLDDEGLKIQAFDHCISTNRRRCELATVYLLPALHRKRREQFQDVFVVLNKVSATKGNSNCYKRIGLLTLTTKAANPPDWQKLMTGRANVDATEFLYL